MKTAHNRPVLGDYELGKTLGEGYSSQVVTGMHVPTGQRYAIKFIDKSKQEYGELKDLAFNELTIMKELNHPNIIKIKEMKEGVIKKTNGKESPVLYIVLELATGGEVFDYVAITQKFSDKVARYYFGQLLDALEYLHSKGIAHRDLKAENLLLNDSFTLKLADFGFSVSLKGRDGSGVLHTYKGTEGYMAPEIEEGKAYSGEKVDIFAAGVILFILVAELPPFEVAVKSDQCYNLIYNGNYKQFWEFHNSLKNGNFYSPEFIQLVSCMLARNPNDRPSIAQIRQSAWFKGPKATFEEIQAEFKQRKKVLDLENQSQHENYVEMAAEEKKKKSMVGGGKYRGSGMNEEAKEGIPEEEEETMVLEEYQYDGVLKYTEFFTHESPSVLFDNLKSYLETWGIDVNQKEEEYYIDFEKKEYLSGFKGYAKLLKVNAEITCVQFIYTSGNKRELQKIFDKFKNTDGVNNAIYPTEEIEQQ